MKMWGLEIYRKVLSLAIINYEVKSFLDYKFVTIMEERGEKGIQETLSLLRQSPACRSRSSDKLSSA